MTAAVLHRSTLIGSTGYHENLVSSSNSEGEQTYYQYDLADNVILTRNEAGDTNLFTYDAGHHVTSHTDPTGAVTQFSYDANGNQISSLAADGAFHQYAYDAEGLLVEEVAPGAGVTSFARDGHGNVVGITSPEGRVTQFAYDQRGRITQRTDPLGLSTVWTYDGKNRVINVRDPNGSSTALVYDLAGRPTRATDPAGQAITLNWDSVYRVASLTDPAGRTTTFSYDAMSNLTGLTTPAGRQTLFSRNALGQLASVTYPGQAQDQYTYDLIGRLTQAVDEQGRTASFEYALNGEVSAESLSDGSPDLNLAYDAAGRLIALSSGADVLTRTYDVLGRIANETSTMFTSSVDHAYDLNGQVTNRTVNGTSSCAYGYDADGLLTSAQALGCFPSMGCACNMGATPCTDQTQSLSLSVERDGSGREVGSILGDVNSVRSYDAFGRAVSEQFRFGATPLFSETVTLDRLGRIVGSLENVGGVATEYTYAYDLQGKLKQVFRNGTLSSAYTYDNNGNRLTRATPAGTTLGSHDQQDRLLTYGSWAYTYVSSGELQSKTNTSTNEVTSYTYDMHGALTEVVTPAGHLISYEIDPSARRVGREVDGVLTHRWLYQDDLEPVAELNDNNELVSLYVYGTRSHVPDFIMRDGVTYRVVADHVGSVRLVVDVATGVIAQRIDYDEFGKVLVDTNPGFQPFGFAGGLYDADTGLVRFGARDYDAVTGRWTAKDPILFGGGDTNLYAYVNSDPVNLIDPRGLELPVMEPYDPTGKTPLGPGVPFDLPFGPSREEHANRNQYNRCPSHAPTMCGGNAEDDFQYDDRRWVGGKWRGAGGNECAYGSDGNLLPDPEQTFNFYPNSNTPGHGWNDWFAHYWYGGAGGYTPGQTEMY